MSPLSLKLDHDKSRTALNAAETKNDIRKDSSDTNIDLPSKATVVDITNSSNKLTEEEGYRIFLKTLKAGDATHYPQNGNTVRVHYEGYLSSSSDGFKFDSSRDRNKSFLFRLGRGQIIEGLDVAITQMSLGQVAEITIPHIYAYGKDGYPPLIPPKSTLVFQVELLDFTDII